ncbi:MAG: DUF177 domain-containing protein [Clostridia bacterium]|nr:DUF177 domain-containing protein [Clostridia bacterium]
MHIVLRNLQEGHSYKFKNVYDASLGLADIVDASVEGDITLTGTYLWINEELMVRVTTSYDILAHCDLCGEPTKTRCSCTLDEGFTPDSQEYIAKEDAIDIMPLIKECIVFSIVRTVRCSKNCKGVCPTCGQNLNKGDCKCDNNIEDSNPFGILKKLINTGGAKDGITKKKNI